MESEKLYVNNETISTETYVGTYDEFKRELSDIIPRWYRDYSIIYETDTDPDKGEQLSYTEFESKTLKEGLNIADSDEIRSYYRITDIVPHVFNQ